MIKNINSINGNMNVQDNVISLSNIKSKNIENQLINKKQRLKEISGDSKMAEKEKLKERQKIQQQIAELNRKLKMEQIKEEEKKVEKEQENKIVHKEKLQKEEILKQKDKKETESEEEKKIELKNVSSEELYKILNINLKIQQDCVMQNVERKKDGMENVLSSEIKMDNLYGIDNKIKKEQLSEMRKEKTIQIKELGFEEESNILGINTNRKIIIRVCRSRSTLP